MSTSNMLVAGYGGQGILFTGKFLVSTGLIKGKHVSWFPSYGPEMRGGTSNCSVIISDDPIGSPIVSKPEVLFAMNAPSIDKFESLCVEGATVYMDSSLISRTLVRDDLKVYSIPAAKLASESGVFGLGNMIMMGKFIKETGICSYDDMEAAVKMAVSENKKELHDSNLKALDIGYNL